MRRYVYGFVNSHDPEVSRAIMAPDYTLNAGSDTLVGRDEVYIPAVMRAISQTPGLTMTIHELITDGGQTAMLFSEHGRAARFPDRAASWRGVGIYRAAGGRLTGCWIEQDYFGKRVQSERGQADPVSAVAVDPWTNHRISSAEDAALARHTIDGWLAALSAWPPPHAIFDRGIAEDIQPRIDVTQASLNTMVAEGTRVAFNATASGSYRGGLPDCETEGGVPVHINFGAFATVTTGTLTDIDGISGRLFVQTQLRADRPGERRAQSPPDSTLIV